jgi:hypothetical protein
MISCGAIMNGHVSVDAYNKTFLKTYMAQQEGASVEVAASSHGRPLTVNAMYHGEALHRSAGQSRIGEASCKHTGGLWIFVTYACDSHRGASLCRCLF